MDRYEAEYEEDEEVASAIIFWKAVMERCPSAIAREQLASLEAKADRLAQDLEEIT